MPSGAHRAGKVIVVHFFASGVDETYEPQLFIAKVIIAGDIFSRPLYSFNHGQEANRNHYTVCSNMKQYIVIIVLELQVTL
jgi:hypothetical protein